MKQLLAFLFFLVAPLLLQAQQLPYTTAFDDNAFVWNPGMTAHWNYMEVGANYRQQWFGFDGAPRTALARFQFPFVNNNMAVGAAIVHDVAGPLTYNNVMLTYAYRIPVGDEGQLSAGIMGSFNQYRLDGTELEARDQADQLLFNGESSKIQPNAGIGLFYSSLSEYDYNFPHFYAGFAVHQLIPSELVFDELSNLANFQRALHANAVIGGKFAPGSGYFLIDPSLWINYSAPGIYLVTANLKVELEEVFFSGVTIASDSTVGVQAGGIIGGLGDGFLRIGILGTFNLSSSLSTYQGLGYEFFVGYRFEID
jgi:type IX secretion system PorP/SprF family membrane protein